MKKKIFNNYVEFILEEFSITKEELFSSGKVRKISFPRFVLYYICYKRPMTYTDISNLMKTEGLDIKPSNVRYGIERIEQSDDQDYKNLIESCINKFK